MHPALVRTFSTLARLPLSFAVAAAAAAAQNTAAPITFVRVDAAFPSDRGAFRDHAAHLAALHRRHGNSGFRIQVVLPEAAATRVAATPPPFGLSARADIAAVKYVVQQLPALTAWEAAEPDVVEDLVAASLRPDAERHLARMGAAWRLVSANLEDGPGMPHGSALFVELFPRTGYAHACRYIDLVWYRADLVAARAAAIASLDALAGESWPLVRFCDLVLRADANDPVLAARIGKALEPVIAAEPDAPLARLCALRAALRVDPAAVTTAAVEALVPLVDGDGEAMRQLAEIVALAPDAPRFRAVAERVLGAAGKLPIPAPRLIATQYLVAARCANDAAAAAEALARFVGKGEDAARAHALNALAWPLLVGFDSMGRFDPLALALMEKASDGNGGTMSDALLDTMALALFSVGRFDDAIALQTKAIADTDGDPRYECRLLRYRRTRDTSRR